METLTKSIHVRDTLILVDTFNSLEPSKKAEILTLINEFNKIPYIDVRTQLGPDQINRMSKKQKDSISNNACKVFSIENKIKELLKTEAQVSKELIETAIKDKNNKIDRIKYRIRDIENFLQRKLLSNRQNPTKMEYEDLKNQLATLI